MRGLAWTETERDGHTRSDFVLTSAQYVIHALHLVSDVFNWGRPNKVEMPTQLSEKPTFVRKNPLMTVWRVNILFIQSINAMCQPLERIRNHKLKHGIKLL